MMERAVKAFNDGTFLNEFIPVPKDLTDTVAGFVGGDKQAELEAKEKANQEKYGYSNWYDFCVAEWGTKWDISPYEPVTLDGDRMTITFDSAWSPPINAYEKLVEMGFEIRAYYYECGMAFCGVWEDGYDDYYEISGMSSDEVADMLPEELDEMFYISGNIAEWEEENEEELDAEEK